jgi:hypothetical protein
MTNGIKRSIVFNGKTFELYSSNIRDNLFFSVEDIKRFIPISDEDCSQGMFVFADKYFGWRKIFWKLSGFVEKEKKDSCLDKWKSFVEWCWDNFLSIIWVSFIITLLIMGGFSLLKKENKVNKINRPIVVEEKLTVTEDSLIVIEETKPIINKKKPEDFEKFVENYIDPHQILSHHKKVCAGDIWVDYTAEYAQELRLDVIDEKFKPMVILGLKEVEGRLDLIYMFLNSYEKYGLKKEWVCTLNYDDEEEFLNGFFESSLLHKRGEGPCRSFK